MEFKIENMFHTKTYFEANIVVGGFTYLVIYGEHVNGGFCCVPNWNWGCEMGEANQISYNRDKLIECGASKEVATEIAKAIDHLSNK